MRILPDEAELLDAAAHLLAGCRARGLTIVTAESCTGGLVAATLTAIAGSSDVVAGGFVTYSNALKSRLLGVAPVLIERDGAVSDAVARAMAEGALAQSDADLAVGITGIAGPGGGDADKPVGLVFIAALRRDEAHVVRRCIFAGDRQQVRSSSVRTALELLAYCGGVALSSSGIPPIAPP